jgi:hypothetical protein
VGGLSDSFSESKLSGGIYGGYDEPEYFEYHGNY